MCLLAIKLSALVRASICSLPHTIDGLWRLQDTQFGLEELQGNEIAAYCRAVQPCMEALTRALFDRQHGLSSPTSALWSSKAVFVGKLSDVFHGLCMISKYVIRDPRRQVLYLSELPAVRCSMLLSCVEKVVRVWKALTHNSVYTFLFQLKYVILVPISWDVKEVRTQSR